MSIKVLSLGGSLVAPEGIAVDFLKEFREVVLEFLHADQGNRIILVVGGGFPARSYQQAARELTDTVTHDELDWVGIAATKLNAALVKTVFVDYCLEPVVDNPETADFKKGRLLVGAGWKPGFSSDYDAALLAHRFHAKELINLSNISYVYSADPKKDPSAKALKEMSWQELTALVGDTWVPGSNLPFDPIAAKFSMEHDLSVVVANGKELDNLRAILHDEPFNGTTIR